MASKKDVKIGVLALQGDVLEHLEMMDEVLKKKGIATKTVTVRRPDQLEGLTGLIIPGGESTVMSRLGSEKRFGKVLLEEIHNRVKNGLAVFGTCAGCIMLAKDSSDKVVRDFTQELLGVMDITVVRNQYGRQQDSFELPLKIDGFDKNPFPGVFIRAPVIVSAKEEVEVLCRNANEIFAAKQGKILAVTFHPEITADTRFHDYFLKLVMS